MTVFDRCHFGQTWQFSLWTTMPNTCSFIQLHLCWKALESVYYSSGRNKLTSIQVPQVAISRPRLICGDDCGKFDRKPATICIWANMILILISSIWSRGQMMAILVLGCVRWKSCILSTACLWCPSPRMGFSFRRYTRTVSFHWS